MQPLAGLTILDLSRLLPGPYASWLLRSWGARVIKVEEPALGDYLREMQPLWFGHLNAGAESVAIDLKRAGGRELLLRLLPRVDLVMESFRPGVMERLGLSYEELSRHNPRLVLLSVSGFGAPGPHAARPGHDLSFLARSGLLPMLNGLPAFQLGDMAAGMMAAAAGLAALLGARSNGAGSHARVSVHDTLISLGSMQAVESLAGCAVSREEMLLGGHLPAYRIYPTADGGQVALAALEPKFWQAFCQAVERPDWLNRQGDPALTDELTQLFLGRSRGCWQELAAVHPDACFDPVLSISEAAESRFALQPAQFNGQRPLAGGAPPGRGADTEKFLRESGLSEQEIAGLAAEGCIAVASAE